MCESYEIALKKNVAKLDVPYIEVYIKFVDLNPIYNVHKKLLRAFIADLCMKSRMEVPLGPTRFLGLMKLTS